MRKSGVRPLLVSALLATGLAASGLSMSCAPSQLPSGKPPVVQTKAATGVTQNVATLNGNISGLGSNSKVTVSFQWGITTSYGNTTTPEVKVSTGSFIADIAGLTANTTYHFRAKADNGSQTVVYGADMAFTTSPSSGTVRTAMVVTTGSATGITPTGATLNGSIDNLGTASTVTLCFDWGTTASYGSSTPVQSRGSTGAYNAVLTGLPVGVTYHYRAKATSSLGVTYGADQAFTTSSTSPTAVTLFTTSATSIMPTSATLNGNLSNLGASPSIQVSFDYGTSTSYGSSTAIQARTTAGAFNANLPGLYPSTTYHYRAKATGSSGVTYGDDVTFTTTSLPPSVTTISATSITATSVTLNGNLTSLGGTGYTTVYFDWGTSTSYGNSTPAVSRTATGTYSAILSYPSPSTTYYFRAVADGGTSGIAYGPDLAFTTLTQVTAPEVFTDTVTNVTTAGVTLNGNLYDLGTSLPSTVFFEWGASTSYGYVTGAQSRTSTGSFTTSLTGLTASTTYHYRAKAVSSAGTSYGDDTVFTTSAIAPTVTTAAAASITGTGATLNGNLTSLTGSASLMVSFDWGTSTSYGNTTSAITVITTGAFNAAINSLTPNTIYHFRAKADNGAGGIGYGSDMSFSTSGIPPVMNTGAATDIAADSATLNGELAYLGSASSINVSFDWGTTTSYGNTTTPVAQGGTGVFNTPITGLSPGTTYHFRAKGLGHGTGIGADQTFMTLPVAPAVTTSDPGNVTDTTAVLNGNVASMGTASTVSVSFEWGTVIPYTSTTTIQTRGATGAFTITATGMAPNTLYHYRAKVDGGVHGISYGDDKTVTTGRQAPAVTTSPATGMTSSAAVLRGSLSNMGTANPVAVCFEWGTALPYANTTPIQNLGAAGAFSDTIGGLSPYTTYHFRAKATGDNTTYGADQTFTTLAVPATLTTGSASSISHRAATLNGNLTALGSSSSVQLSFEWGLTTSYGSSTSPVSASVPCPMTASITGLSPNTRYHYRAKATGQATGYGPDMTFITPVQYVVAANSANTFQSLSVINTETNTAYGPFLNSQLTTPFQEPWDIEVTPDGRTALIASRSGNMVLFVDLTTPLSPVLQGCVNLPYPPVDLAFTPDGRYALAFHAGTPASTSAVTCIDMVTHLPLYCSPIVLPAGNYYSRAVAIAPDGTVLTIGPGTAGDDLGAFTLDPATHAIVAPGNHYASGLSSAANVAVAPDGQTVLVCNDGNDTVSVYRITAPGTLAYIGVVAGLPGHQQSIAFNEAGTKAYVLSLTNPDKISVLNITGPGAVSLGTASAATLNAVSRLAGAGNNWGVDTVAVAGNRAYIGGAPTNNKLAVVDLTTFAVTYLDVGTWPAGVTRLR